MRRRFVPSASFIPRPFPEKGHLMVVPDIPNDDSPEVIDWIQTYMEWMDGNPEYSKRTVEQTQIPSRNA